MSIFKDSYHTTIGSMYITKDIENSIREAIITDYINSISLDVVSNGEYNPIFIIGNTQNSKQIPLFIHPITILTSKNGKSDKYLCTDLRLFLKGEVDPFNITKHIRNPSEFNFSKNRAILNLIWLNEGTNNINKNLYFASMVFSSWLSDIISKTYALDFNDQTVISVISSYYYQSLFMEEDKFDENTKQRMAVHTIKTTKLNDKYIFSIFDQIDKMSSINDFIENIIKIVNNPRLGDFNLGMLLTIIKNSWYGTNSKEIISVALEHPPTWIAIVHSVLTDPMFKHTILTKICEKVGKKGLNEEFVKNYTMYINDYTSNISRESLLDSLELLPEIV